MHKCASYYQKARNMQPVSAYFWLMAISDAKTYCDLQEYLFQLDLELARGFCFFVSKTLTVEILNCCQQRKLASRSAQNRLVRGKTLSSFNVIWGLREKLSQKLHTKSRLPRKFLPFGLICLSFTKVK